MKSIPRRIKPMLPPKILRPAIHHFGRSYVRYFLREEFDRQTFTLNERAIEYRFVFEKISALSPRSVLDVGSGTTALPALIRSCGAIVTASDKMGGYCADGLINKHWLIQNDDIENSQLAGPFDFITCVSVLEHIRNFDEAIRNMFRLLVPGGHLLITCPYSESRFIENVYDLDGVRGGYRSVSYICRSYSRNEVSNWVAENGASIVAQEYWKIESGDYHALGEWLTPPLQVGSDEQHQLTCLLLKKNLTSKIK